jgi:hypothetical protein
VVLSLRICALEIWTEMQFLKFFLLYCNRIVLLSSLATGVEQSKPIELLHLADSDCIQSG